MGNANFEVRGCSRSRNVKGNLIFFSLSPKFSLILPSNSSSFDISCYIMLRFTHILRKNKKNLTRGCHFKRNSISVKKNSKSIVNMIEFHKFCNLQLKFILFYYIIMISRENNIQMIKNIIFFFVANFSGTLKLDIF